MRLKARQSGLTLIELVMTIVLVGILAGMMTFSIREVVSLWNFWSFRTEVVSQGRLAMARMVREMRQVNNNTSITAAEISRLQFINTDGSNIEYRLAGTDLLRNSNVLAGGVKNLVFSYYNTTFALIAAVPLDAQNRSRVRSIGVSVNIGAGDQNRTLYAVVSPRNL